MELLGTPRNKKGEKNVFCPYYCSCLEHAVRSKWDYWDCSNCESKGLTESVPLPDYSPHNPDLCHSVPNYIWNRMQV